VAAAFMEVAAESVVANRRRSRGGAVGCRAVDEEDEGREASVSVSDEAPHVTLGLPLRRGRRGRRCLLAMLAALIAGGAVLLFLNVRLLVRRREARAAALLRSHQLLWEPVSPVDRNRVVGAQRSMNISAVVGVQGSSISVAQMARIPIGVSHVPQWPLFWILTAPQHEPTRCEEIIGSWGRLVPTDSLIFFGALANRTSASGHRFFALDVAPERKAAKELLAWRFALAVFPGREWFVKGDDDTFFVVRNLNRYLEEFDPRLPYFLGCKFHYGGPGGVQYHSGGAGYVLSRTAALRLAGATPHCLRIHGQLTEGDVAVAECLQMVGVVPEDTRDERGRQRFHTFPYSYHLNWHAAGLHKKSAFWYYDWVWGPIVEGADCCGDNTTVSFHYMEGQMRTFTFPTLRAPMVVPQSGKEHFLGSADSVDAGGMSTTNTEFFFRRQTTSLAYTTMTPLGHAVPPLGEQGSGSDAGGWPLQGR